MNLRNSESFAKPEESLKNTVPPFPIFVKLEGKRVTVVGGGAAASKRIKALFKFGAEIYIISPEIIPELAGFVRDGKAVWLKSNFAPQLLEGSDLVIAASNMRETNRQVAEAAKRMQMLVCVTDSREESSFNFPAIVQSEGFVAGIFTLDEDYSSLKNIATRIYKKFSGR